MDTVATGRVERGTLHLNDEVEIIGVKEETQKTVITGIECSESFLMKLRLVITSVLFKRYQQRPDRKRSGSC